MVKITDVLKHSRAYKVGVRSNDILISINDHDITDVLDYRFYLAEEHLKIVIIQGSEEKVFVIDKDVYDDIGLDFETPLMDKKHHCENKCIFCFIDQLPKGLRESLYFKDDDSRLSFLHGNYITLTNLYDNDIKRIKEMHISPVNISVHTTNPELRVKMMKNPRSGEVLSYMKDLADAGITLRCQIVLCKNINDKHELDRTMNDLLKLYPKMDSCSIVTAGITGYREGLYNLESFSCEDCKALISQVEKFADKCFEMYGNRIFYCSDEIYIKAGIKIPSFDKWGDFSQIENGVGMVASFEHEFELGISTLSKKDKSVIRKISIATGEASYQSIKKLVDLAKNEVSGLDVNIYKIKNNFFGGEITVTGLLTGVDLYDQLKDKELGEELLLSRTMLRAEGDMFLCNMTPDDLSKKLNVKIRFTECDGMDFLYSLLGD